MVVDVEPFASGGLRVGDGDSDGLGADPGVLMAWAGLGVEQKGMIAAVPRHVDEPDQRPVTDARRHPAEAVGPDLVPPSCRRTAAVGLDQVNDLVVGRWPLHSKEIWLSSGIAEASPMAGATIRGIDDERPGLSEVGQPGKGDPKRAGADPAVRARLGA